MEVVGKWNTVSPRVGLDIHLFVWNPTNIAQCENIVICIIAYFFLDDLTWELAS